jgi:hypothetical protein
MKIQRFNESSDFKEVKTISDLIDYLQEVKEKEGDISVCHSESHDYWGSVESWLVPGYNLNVSEHAQPDGPKSGKSVKALVFGGN